MNTLQSLMAANQAAGQPRAEAMSAITAVLQVSEEAGLKQADVFEACASGKDRFSIDYFTYSTLAVVSRYTFGYGPLVFLVLGMVAAARMLVRASTALISGLVDVIKSLAGAAISANTPGIDMLTSFLKVIGIDARQDAIIVSDAKTVTAALTSMLAGLPAPVVMLHAGLASLLDSTGQEITQPSSLGQPQLYTLPANLTASQTQTQTQAPDNGIVDNLLGSLVQEIMGALSDEKPDQQALRVAKAAITECLARGGSPQSIRARMRANATKVQDTVIKLSSGVAETDDLTSRVG